MEVKHRLAAVGVGVHDDAVAPLGQLGVTRQVAREGEQATEQLWIPRIVERREVISRNHEQVGRGLRIQILERHHTVGPLHDRRRNLARRDLAEEDRKSTRLNSSHSQISYAVFCLKKKKNNDHQSRCWRTASHRGSSPLRVYTS